MCSTLLLACVLWLFAVSLSVVWRPVSTTRVNGPSWLGPSTRVVETGLESACMCVCVTVLIVCDCGECVCVDANLLLHTHARARTLSWQITPFTQTQHGTEAVWTKMQRVPTGVHRTLIAMCHTLWLTPVQAKVASTVSSLTINVTVGYTHYDNKNWKNS